MNRALSLFFFGAPGEFKNVQVKKSLERDLFCESCRKDLSDGRAEGSTALMQPFVDASFAVGGTWTDILYKGKKTPIRVQPRRREHSVFHSTLPISFIGKIVDPPQQINIPMVSHG